MENEENMNINKLAGGAIQESVNYALEEIFQNIKDPNTEAEKTRKLTITMELKPDESRQFIKTKTTTKTTLAPANSIVTQLLLDKNGEKIVATELLKNNPNQISFDELEEDKENKIININKEAK